jgi:hypothetical protein
VQSPLQPRSEFLASYYGIKQDYTNPEGRTFKGPFDVWAKEWEDKTEFKRKYFIKDERTSKEVLFDENEKLYNLYLMIKVTKRFVGLDLGYLGSEDSASTILTLFNSAAAIIHHMNLRYTRALRDKVLELYIPISTIALLSEYGPVWERYKAYYKPPETLSVYPVYPVTTLHAKYINYEVPYFYIKDLEANWGLIDKVSREFAILERTGAIIAYEQVGLLYEILWCYYHNVFGPRIEMNKKLLSALTTFF